MPFKILNIIIIFFSLTIYSYSAGTSGGKTKSNFDQASKLIKDAKKYEKKGKEEKPNQPNTLNYLGFTSRKLGNFEKGEEYYLLGLKIDPNHTGINEYLGELYFVTDRIDLAKERLSVLKNCNCEEYKDLKEIIEGKKQSKY